ncbi:bifunctional [glutamine synthetase] adenylyltransferase/[glutamine synthetase]-adenylyl-L-tyrosine phosphorylase, partial [uncultured Propionibacterium sp.]|uniref:bifunctional [glutamine synthetase] adenylyltransferase/[glutamine synthetase]-adenylyl-L-tyrosine phosphorylase n=1 Tax=uncultured Propionibacterium sp. TaxID=218066 RepID=UPI00292D987D
GAGPDELARAVASAPDAADRLRLANKRHLVRIAGRDLASPDPSAVVGSVAAELTDLADAVMVCALAIARGLVPDQAKARLGVIALGKCGAQELNYLSDIDVLFVAEPADETVPGAEATAVGNLIAAAITRICSAHCASGTIWQVDAALRPEGRKGPLTRTLSAHRAYYERWAKNWEFQAMLKARPMAGHPELTRGFCRIVEPLVWQAGGRDDFMSEAQAMRRRVVNLIPAKDAEAEIKLGTGGLRDVEFSVQLLQLVHGRVDERLRLRGTLPALHALAQHGYIGRGDASELDRAYRFERTVEHRIQLFNLRRSHLMPPGDDDRRRIARSLGMHEGEELWGAWRRTARDVGHRQRRIFYSPLLEAVSHLSDEELRLSPQAAQDRLKALGFADPRSALAHIEALTRGASRTAEIQRQLMPAMLGWFAEGPNPDLGLLSFRQLSEAMGGTSWYMRALRDEGQMAELLAAILSSSRYVIRMIGHVPGAVQMLADVSQLAVRTRESLFETMSAAARRHDDTDGAVEALRTIRCRELTRLALGDALGLISTQEVGAGLSAVMSATIDVALQIASREEAGAVPPIGVVAMGRWGGAELSYGSDADAMFVVPDGTPAEQTAAAIRVVARLRALLKAPGRGPALEIDADLRPEGRDGAMVRTLTGYLNYYERWSSTWEHQALVRADYGAGDRQSVGALLGGIARLRWPEGGLRPEQIAEIRRLKARMERERIRRGTDPHRNLKLGPGGLSDVEWTVQLLQMQHAGGLERLRTPTTLAALAAMREAGLVDEGDAQALGGAWRLASALRDHTMLVSGRSSDLLPSDPRDLAAIAMQMHRDMTNASELIEDWERTSRRASNVVDRIFWERDS